jgi:hypothetical protein
MSDVGKEQPVDPMSGLFLEPPVVNIGDDGLIRGWTDFEQWARCNSAIWKRTTDYAKCCNASPTDMLRLHCRTLLALYNERLRIALEEMATRPTQEGALKAYPSLLAERDKLRAALDEIIRDMESELAENQVGQRMARMSSGTQKHGRAIKVLEKFIPRLRSARKALEGK